MSFSEFFGRKGQISPAEKYPAAADKFPSLSPGKGPNGEDRPAESWAEMGSRIGGDNEALRNLLVDTGHRIGALDELKDAFNKLVDPIQKTLRVLELEKSENVSLKGTLSDIRSSYEALRTEFNELGRRSASGETEIERLRHELDQVQQSARTAEITKSELSDELSTVRGKLAEVERLHGQEITHGRTLHEEKLLLADHGATVDKRIVELEAETSLSRERLVLLENEKRSLQNSLEQLVGENARLLRRANESDAALSNARTRLEQLETALTSIESERNKLTTTVDEAHERRQTEANTLNMRLEATQSRATAAEKLLAEVRQSLVARTEENRASERKVVEATIARNATEKKLEQLLASLQGQERQIRDMESSRTALVERSGTLQKTVKTRETALTRAEEKIQALTDRLTKSDGDAEAGRIKTEKRVEELNSALQRERLERAVSEGALEATRKNYVELQRELASERGGKREYGKPEAVADSGEKAKAKAAIKPVEAKPAPAATVEPIIAP